MSIQQIIGQLEKILQLHKSLLTLSIEKTEMVKSNNIDSFNEILIQERKHVQAIEQLEAKRVEWTNQWFTENAPNAKEQTISHLIDRVTVEEEKKRLSKLYEDFIYVLADLKQQEKLNQDLIQQSLQFLELSLEMFQPNFKKNMNYEKPKATKSSRTNTSVFDSKA